MNLISKLINWNRQRADLIRQRDDLIRQRDDLIRQRDGLIKKNIDNGKDNTGVAVHPILFNTLPKSASVFILETLALTLNKSIVTISSGYFPRDLVDFRSLGQLVDVKGIAQSHLDASEFNCRFITKIKKVIVQFRDPRQSTLSWLHHLDRLEREKNHVFLETVSPLLPDNYFEYSFHEKLEYQLKFYLPQVITWMIEWVHFSKINSDDQHLMINTYEDFVKDPVNYFKKIFIFLGIENPEMIQLPDVRPTTEKNFRLGDPNEWRTVFTEAQIKYAENVIPKNLSSSFGWC